MTRDKTLDDFIAYVSHGNAWQKPFENAMSKPNIAMLIRWHWRESTWGRKMIVANRDYIRDVMNKSPPQCDCQSYFYTFLKSVYTDFARHLERVKTVDPSLVDECRSSKEIIDDDECLQSMVALFSITEQMQQMATWYVTTAVGKFRRHNLLVIIPTSRATCGSAECHRKG